MKEKFVNIFSGKLSIDQGIQRKPGHMTNLAVLKFAVDFLSELEVLNTLSFLTL